MSKNTLDVRLAPDLSREMMDDPDCEPVHLEKALDVLAAAGLLGGTRACAGLVSELLADTEPGALSILDVGAGGGDSTADVVRGLAASGWRPHWVLGDIHRTTLELGRSRMRSGDNAALPARIDFVRLAADRLPFKDRSFDIVLTTTTLHHLRDWEALGFFREATRVARRGWIALDLRRTAVSYALVRALCATVWRRSLFTRNDAPISVRRAFREPELRELLDRAGVPATVRRLGPVRLSAHWRRGGAQVSDPTSAERAG